MAALSAACAAGSRDPAAAPPRPAGESRPDPRAAPALLHLQPTSARYLIEIDTRITQEFLGQPETQELAVRTFLRTDVRPLDAGFAVTMIVDSVVPDSGARVPGVDVEELYEGMRDLHLTARFGHAGQPLTTEGGEPGGTAVQELLDGLRHFYPRLALRGVAPGVAWADTTEQQQSVCGLVTMVRTIRAHRATGWISVPEGRALEILTEARRALAGRAEQGGQELELSGSGTRAGRVLLSASGDYLGGTVTDSTDVGVRVVDRGVVVPVVCTSTATTHRLR